jgi:hypothetical protein
MYNRKTREHIQPTLDFLEQENIPYELGHSSKHGTLVVTVNGHEVRFTFSRSPSDGRSTLNFKAQVKRAILRHRENTSSKEPV